MLHVRRPGTARLYPARSRAGGGLMADWRPPPRDVWQSDDAPPQSSCAPRGVWAIPYRDIVFTPSYTRFYPV